MVEGLQVTLKNSSLVIQAISEIVINISNNDGNYERLLPSEAVLAERLSVSRSTIREALSKLEDEGIVIRRHGVGTFVSPMAEDHRGALKGWFSETPNFIDVISNSGYEPDCKLLNLEISPAGEVSKHLDINQDSQVVYYERLFLASSEPVILCKNFVPLSHVLLSKRDLVSVEHKYIQSTYNFVWEYCHKRIAYHEAVVSAVIANKRQSDLLDCNIGTPLIFTEDAGFASEMTPLWYGYYWYRGDKVKLAQMRNPKLIIH
jgi:GntR family transcriptional regulator